MPSGIHCTIFPFGPSTVTTLPCTEYFTPEGTGIGFLPTRDIVQSFMACESRCNLCLTVPLQPQRINSLFIQIWSNLLPTLSEPRRRRSCPSRPGSPDLAENFAAHAFAPCLTAGHDSARRGENADAEAALHTADLVAANIDAAAGTR